MYMRTSDLFKVFDFELGNIIIERYDYDDAGTFYDEVIINEDVICNIRQAGTWLFEQGDHDILKLSVIDYDSRKSAQGITTLRVLIV